MSSLTSIIFIIVIIVLAVAALAIIQKRESEKAAIRQKVAQYRYRANQTTDLLNNMQTFPLGDEAQTILLQYAHGCLLAIAKISPTESNNKKNIQALKTQLDSSNNAAQPKLVVPRDIQVLTQQINGLTNLAKYLLKLQKSPVVDSELVPVAVSKISQLIAELKISAYVQQGKDSLAKQEIIPAQKSLLMANQMLAKVQSKNPRLLALEKELAGLIKSSPEVPDKVSKLTETDPEDKQTESTAASIHDLNKVDEVFGPKKKW